MLVAFSVAPSGTGRADGSVHDAVAAAEGCVRRAVRVGRVCRGHAPVVVHVARGGQHARLVPARREVGQALTVRHRDRQARAGHAGEEDGRAVQDLDQGQPRLVLLEQRDDRPVRVKRGHASAPGIRSASAANIWQPLQMPRPKVSSRAKKALKDSVSRALKRTERAQPSPAPSVSP